MSTPERPIAVKLKAFAYKVLGDGLLLVSPWVFALGAQSNEHNVLLILLFMGVSVTIFKLGMRCRRHARRLEAVPAECRLALDPRAPVVYFRSFRDDEVSSNMMSIAGVQGCGSQVVTKTEEEQIVNTMEAIGPVIALGMPGDTLPQVGAARRYIKGHEDWKNVVTQFVTDASAIVMRAGLTEGFWWEFELAIRLMPPERILILIPFSLEEYRLFRTRAEQYLRSNVRRYYNLPSYNGKNVYSSLTGCIVFEQDWTPHFRRMRWCESRFATADTPLVTILEQMCAPFFEHCKVPKGEKPPIRVTYEDGEYKYKETLSFEKVALRIILPIMLPVIWILFGQLITKPSLVTVAMFVFIIILSHVLVERAEDLYCSPRRQGSWQLIKPWG